MAAGALVALEVIYLLGANLALGFGLIPRAVSGATENVRVTWASAYSLWPGHVSVSGFSMQLEDDHTVQLDLAVDHSTARLSLTSLLQRRVKLTRVRASGVSYRMSTKMSAASALASPRRVAAFPVIGDFAFPPLKPDAAPPPLDRAAIDALWQVELQDVEAEIRELWFDEYRYVGPAYVSGAFALAPLKSLWVGPATLRLDGGTLSVGTHTLTSNLTARVDTTIAPVDLLDAEPTAMLPALTAYLRTELRLQDLGFLEVYLDGVELGGEGLASIDVVVANGALSRDSKVRLTLTRVSACTQGFTFAGRTDVAAGVTDAGTLQVKAGLFGDVTSPQLDGQAMVMHIGDAAAELTFSSNVLATPPAFQNLSAHVNGASATDARPLTRLAATYVPVIAPAVLGDGPLTASATATVTPEYALLRITQSKLGDASVEGAVLASGGKWNGAAAGRFGKLPLGLLLENGRFGYRPSTSSDWLPAELARAGIKPR